MSIIVLNPSNVVGTGCRRGRGVHGAVPQRTVDPVVVCSAIVLALQSIVSRNVDPQDTAIVSVGAIHAGTVSNVIPASAE